MMDVTLWYKYDEGLKKYIYNHMSQHKALGSYPLPVSPNNKAQNNWKKYKWIKKYGRIKHYKIILDL